MKKLLLTICGIYATGLLLAQPLPQWSSTINSNFIHYTYDNPKIKFDNAGDLVVVAGVVNGITGRDIAIIKYSPSGSILWQQQFNGISNRDDLANDFEIDSLNNILITGGTATDSINSDLITLKYFPDGSFDWMNTYSGIANAIDQGQSIDVDETGNSYVTGYTSIDSIGHQKLIIAKIDSGGNTVWTYPYGTDSMTTYEGYKIKLLNNEIAILGKHIIPFPSYITKYIAMRLDTSGALIMSNEGVFKKGISSYHIDNIGNFYFGASAAFMISKVNANGIFAWVDSVPSNLPWNVSGDELKAITSDSLQNIYVTGRHYGDDYGGPTYSNADILVIKYSPAGNQIWNKRFEYQSNNTTEIGNDITLDSALNIYVAGKIYLNPTSNNDYLILRYDVNGNETGLIRYNDAGNGEDVITSMVVGDSVNIYVTGVTFDTPLSSTTTQKYAAFSGVGISKINNTSLSVNISPNPSKGKFIISFKNIIKKGYVEIVNTLGGVVFNKPILNESKKEIKLKNISAGIYFVKVFDGEKNICKKIIVE